MLQRCPAIIGAVTAVVFSVPGQPVSAEIGATVAKPSRAARLAPSAQSVRPSPACTLAGYGQTRRNAARGVGGRARADIEALIRTSGADVAVAFRTLDGRDELLIQPDVDYHAASTMKVPVMIELFRQARAGMLTLDDQIPVLNEFHSIVDGSPFALDTGDDSDANVYKRIGSRMSYRDLLEAMI